MVSDFGITKYCRICGLEIIKKGERRTFDAEMNFCKCDFDKIELYAKQKQIELLEKVIKEVHMWQDESFKAWKKDKFPINIYLNMVNSFVEQELKKLKK